MQERQKAVQPFAWGKFIASGLAAAGLAAAMGVQAQTYPNRPVQITYPYQAGGAGENTLRAITSHLQKSWGQPFIIEFRPGGNEVTNMQAVLTGPTDGYLIGVTSQNFSLNPAVQKLPYDTTKDFVPITQFGTFSSPLIVNYNFPAKTLKDFIAYAKANPGKINFANIGNYHKIAMALFADGAGIKLTDVTFKGTADVTTALLGGHVDAHFMSGSVAFPLEKDKRVIILASATPTRPPELPNVPAIAEVVPGFQMLYWLGFIGKAGLPRPIIDRWVAGVREASKAPEVQKIFDTNGFYTASQTSEEMAAFIRKETETLGAAARKLGMAPQ